MKLYQINEIQVRKIKYKSKQMVNEGPEVDQFFLKNFTAGFRLFNLSYYFSSYFEQNENLL